MDTDSASGRMLTHGMRLTALLMVTAIVLLAWATAASATTGDRPSSHEGSWDVEATRPPRRPAPPRLAAAQPPSRPGLGADTPADAGAGSWTSRPRSLRPGWPPSPFPGAPPPRRPMGQAVLRPAGAAADYLAVGNRVLTTAHTAAEQAEDESLLMGIGHTLLSVYPAGAVALLVVVAFVIGLLRHDGVDGHLDPGLATTDQELEFR